MHYWFVNEETPTAGFVRVARGQIERAITELESASDSQMDARVHSVRKRMKKLRGLLRLARPGLERDFAKAEERRFRDVARRLAGSRRAAASSAAFESLKQAAALPEFSLGPVRELLEAERARADSQLGERGGAIEEATAALREGMTALDNLALACDDWEAFCSGLRSVYRRARKAMKRAQNDPTTERLHDWRRWAKHHFYHVRLLEQSFPPVLGGYRKALEELTEILGNEHDLDDLRLTLIETTPTPVLVDAVPPVLAAIGQRRSQLQERAFALGARIFAERPRQVERRFRRYFESWQADAPPPQAQD